MGFNSAFKGLNPLSVITLLHVKFMVKRKRNYEGFLCPVNVVQPTLRNHISFIYHQCRNTCNCHSCQIRLKKNIFSPSSKDLISSQHLNFTYKSQATKRHRKPEYISVSQSGRQSVSTSFCQLKPISFSRSPGHSINQSVRICMQSENKQFVSFLHDR